MPHAGLKTAGRILLAVGGGYWATSSSFALMACLMVACGLPRVEAVTLGMMLAFILYLCLILWVFAVRRIGYPFVVFACLIAMEHVVPVLLSKGH